jgi:predicted nuclease of predicted toxin-antitoxin system
MTIWIDAQMSPSIAAWVSSTFGVHAVAVRDVGTRRQRSGNLSSARKDNAVVMTKDSDFVLLLERFGPPPQVIWVTCGNTSNARLKEILTNTLPRTLELLKSGEKLVEISAVE